jgi:hypothetical protein
MRASEAGGAGTDHRNLLAARYVVPADGEKWQMPGCLVALLGSTVKELMGISAWVEVTGLILWAVDLWRAMGRRPDVAVTPGRLAIGPRTKVFEVNESYPETVALFRQFGFSMIDNPMAQRIFARSVSLEQACRLRHVEFATFQAALNKLVGKNCGDPDDLIQLGGHV